MCVCMRAHVYVCGVCAYVYVSMHVCVYVYACMHMCVTIPLLQFINHTIGTGAFPLSPLSYNTTRSHVFNGTQPSNEGCTNGVLTDGQVTIDYGQRTTLIDCDRGYNDNADYSDLSNYFTWSGAALVDQKVSIVFRFDQQINISRINLFFWNSPSNSILVPDVRMLWADHTMSFNEIEITYDPPNRTKDELYTMNVSISDKRALKLQYLAIEMSNSQWTFLGEVQLCGE